MSNKTLVGILVAGIAGIAIVAGVSLSGGGRTAEAKTCQVGQRNCLPDVSFVDTHGTAFTPKQLAGKVVIVNVWATWCGPCLKEIPALSKIYDKYKDKGLVILGVMHDDPDNQALLNFQSDNNMTYPVIRETSDIIAAYGVDKYPNRLPTTFFYDRQGKEVGQHVGELRIAELEAQVVKLLD